MIANEVSKLEKENEALRETIAELGKKMEQGAVLKPKSCQYCKYYIRHYARNDNGTFSELYYGHCSSGVPASKGRCKKPGVEETCPFFEVGTRKIRYLGTAE